MSNHKIKRSCYKKVVAGLENNGREDEISNPRSVKKVEEDEDDILEKLFHKRGSIREEYFTKLLQAFRSNILLQFAEKSFVTIMHRCEHSLKKGSPLEMKLASQTIGLLALTGGRGSNANELYRECLSVLPQALSLKSKAQPVPILECLAIVTFVGADNFQDTERSMKFLWEYIINASSNEVSDVGVTAAICAWAFLLTTIDSWSLDHKYWKGVIPYFLDLLKAEAEAEAEAEDEDASEAEDEIDSDDEAKVDTEKKPKHKAKIENEAEDRTLEQAVVEALALVFEKDVLEKFCSQPNEYLLNVQNVLKDKKSRQASLNIYGTTLTFSTWSQLKMMSYLKHFLGNGFQRHVLDNEFIRDDVFQYKPNRKFVGTVVYIPEIVEVTAEIFMPNIRNKDCCQRLFRSPNSVMSKGKTRLMKKHRLLAQGMKTGHFLDQDETEDA